MNKFYQHGETGRVVATENELTGDWYEIDVDQYRQALHPLSNSEPKKLCPECDSEILPDQTCMMGRWCGDPVVPVVDGEEAKHILDK